ncbi:MAG TPA: hypothetical protein VKA19_06335, partial [Alphaproteobacteria bacterium]|nr:hypothetical protein [Alphaproteobacteria bacterium]
MRIRTRNRLTSAIFCAAMLLLLSGCSDEAKQTSKPAAASPLDKELIQKYGKPYAALPEANLIAISPNNTDIQREYETAFSR